MILYELIIEAQNYYTPHLQTKHHIVHNPWTFWNISIVSNVFVINLFIESFKNELHVSGISIPNLHEDFEVFELLSSLL